MIERPSPPKQFDSSAHERLYLDDLIRYFVATDAIDSVEGRSSLQRFHQLLSSIGDDDGSILLQDQWALYFELVNDWPAAVGHRTREIELLNSLFELGGPVQQINEAFLSRVKDALARDVRYLHNERHGG